MKKIKELVFGKGLDFRIRLFNIMALGGIIISFLTVLQSIVTKRWSTGVVSLVMMLLSIALLVYATKTEKYQRCYNITIFVIFFLFFPLLFFQSGGYRSGVPAVFIFAVLFTVLMKEGIVSIYLSIFELIEYGFICWIAFRHPDWVIQYETERQILIDIIFSYSFIGIICGIVLYLHLKEFSNQRLLLKEQNDLLKSYDEAKSTFLTTVAHEIKNPLNIIGLYSQDSYELAQESPIDIEQIVKNQKVIEDTVMRLDRIVVDLMDTVSIEQGRLNLSMAPMDLCDLIQESVRYYQKNEDNEEFHHNQIVLHLHEESAVILADYARIFQVMVNLLSNAFRHTKNGTITITLKKTKQGAFVSVEDTGEGMPKEILDNAFQGYVSTDKDYWRHGIGLYICHQIIQAHDGSIWMDSEPGKGTTISFMIPDSEV